MLKNLQNYVAVFAPVVLFVAFCGYFLIQIAMGTEVKVRIQGIDPRDLLAGHYIRYSIDWNNTDCTQFPNKICPQKDFEQSYKFYVPQEMALVLEREIRDTQNRAEIVFSYQKGKNPFALQLLINGKSFKGKNARF